MRGIVVTLMSLVFAAEMAAAAGPAAPSFDLVTLGGKASSKESLKGQPTLLIFWAPWCKVCQKELPLLSQFSQKEKPTQLRMVSVGFSDLRGNVEGYVKAHPDAFAFPTAFDVDNDMAQAFKVTATPTLVRYLKQSATVLAAPYTFTAMPSTR